MKAMTTAKKRESQIELLRIIAMLMILASHCVRYTCGNEYGFLNTPVGLNYYAGLFFSLFGNVGVYLYIIITCWFSVDNVKFSAKRILRVMWQTWTTCVLCIFIAVILPSGKVSLSEIAKELFTPLIEDSHYWFVTAYIVFILLMPILQYTVIRMDNKAVLFFSLFLFFLSPVHNLLNTDIMGYLGDFLSVFFFTAYLKRKPDCILAKKAIWGIIISVLFYILIVILRQYISSDRQINLYNTVFRRMRHRTPLQYMTAFCLFCVVKNWKIGHNKIINSLAQTSFGIYLWHNNLLLKETLWYDLIDVDYWYTQTGLFVLLLILGPIVIYLAFSVIERIRMKLLDDWLYEKLPWNHAIEGYLTNMYVWTKK